ncbi:MAG: hypothetical protein ACK5MR_13990 [Cumulibacter sp.]
MALLAGASAMAFVGVAAGPGASPASAELPAECTQQSETETVRCVYLYTGTTQTFTVPERVHELNIVAVGARGGSGGGETGGAGGLAGVAQIQSDYVYSGTEFAIEVGGVGGDGSAPNPAGAPGGAGGYNGGGDGGSGIAGGGGGGGGGASSVHSSVGADALTVLVASGGGGGGGGSTDQPGGAGGGSGAKGTGDAPGYGPVNYGAGWGGGPDADDGAGSLGGDGASSDQAGGGGGGGGAFGGGGGSLVGSIPAPVGSPGSGGGGGSSKAGDDVSGSGDEGTTSDATEDMIAQVVIEFADPSIIHSAISVDWPSIPGGRDAQVTLTVPARETDTVWTLSTSSDVAVLPATVTLPAESISVTVPMTTSVVTESIEVTITATLGDEVITTTATVHQDTLITTPSLPNAVVGEEYEATFTAVAGPLGQYWWSIPPDSQLPPGLTLDFDGKLTGVPTETGTYGFVVVVTSGSANSREFTLTVVDPVVVPGDPDNQPPPADDDPIGSVDDSVDPPSALPVADVVAPASGEPLAATGADAAPMAMLGGGLPIGGATLMVIGRRRRG